MILVTGATGNVGRNVVEQLLAAGEIVRAIEPRPRDRSPARDRRGGPWRSPPAGNAFRDPRGDRARVPLSREGHEGPAYTLRASISDDVMGVTGRGPSTYRQWATRRAGDLLGRTEVAAARK